MLFREISDEAVQEKGKTFQNEKEVEKFRFGFSDSFIVMSLIYHYMPARRYKR